MQDIIETATAILGNPLVLADSRFRVLYYTMGTEVPIKLWERTMDERYISDEIISSMEKSQMISRLQSEKRPIRYEIPGNYEGIRMPLFYKGRYCGFIGVYNYYRPFEERDEELLIQISKAVSSQIYKESDLVNYEDNAYDSFLYQLLECDEPERAELVCKKNSRLVLGNRKTLICIGKDGDADQKRNMPGGRIKDVLDQRLYHHYSTVHQNRLVLLFERDKMSERLWNDTLMSLREYCGCNGLVAGISFEFVRTAYTPLAYRQAIFAGERSRKRGSEMTEFGACMKEYIFELCLQKEVASFYEHSAIRKLAEYDANFHTDYMNTLRVYLKHFCSLKGTAEEMDVHYNTMKYRLSMIEQIMGLKIRGDDSLKINLLLSLLIRNFYEKEG